MLVTDAGSDRRTRAVAPSGFAALLINTAMARDMYLAAPDVPIHPWFAPKGALWDGALSWLSGGHGSDRDMWQEYLQRKSNPQSPGPTCAF